MSDHTIFLSHATDDDDLATRLRRFLGKRLGVRCYKANMTVEPGRPWRTDIEAALRHCLFGIVLLTEESCTRPWVMGEFLCLRVLNKRVFGVLHGISAAKLPSHLREFQCVSWEEATGSQHFVEVLRAELEASWMKVGDRLIEHLHNTRPLVDHDDVKARFRHSTDCLLSRHFIRYWLDQYCGRLSDAKNRRMLTLPSPNRMLAAVDAIDGAKKEIRAIAIVRNDRWVCSSPYLEANLKARKRNIPISRLLILQSDLESQYLDETVDVFERQLRAGIELRYLLQSDHDHIRKNNPAYGLLTANLLICDEHAMTLSNDDTDHGGHLVVHEEQILEERLKFELLWKGAAQNRLNRGNLRKVLSGAANHPDRPPSHRRRRDGTPRQHHSSPRH